MKINNIKFQYLNNNEEYLYLNKQTIEIYIEHDI